MSRVDSRPWLKFRPDRWLGDAQLQSCSLAAQGLWINLVALMHQSSEYGYLTYRGVAATPKDIAKMLPRLAIAEIESHLKELQDEGVFYRREADNCIYSKRMVEDFQSSVFGSEARAKAWEGKRKSDLIGDGLLVHKTEKKTENKTRRRVAQLCKLPLPFTPKDRERDLAFNELKMNFREFDDSLADFINWASTKGRKTHNPDWDMTFAGHLRRDAKSWGTRYRKETPSPFKATVSRHAKAATAAKSPDWFSKLEVRFIDANLEKDWQTIWSRCIPVSDGNPVVLRAPSKAIYRTATQPNDMLRFMTAVGRPVDLQPPTSPSRSR